MYNPSNYKDKFFEQLIEDDFEDQLKSESGQYVVFDGTSTIIYEGDMPHCFLYAKHYRKHQGFWPTIYSIECYNRMMDQINGKSEDKDTFDTFWDYVAFLNKGTNKWRMAIDLGVKYHDEGKNPDEYLDEIIKKVEKIKD